MPARQMRFFMPFYGLGGLLIAAIVSQRIRERAYRSLANGEKTELTDGLAKRGKYAWIPLAVLVSMYLLALNFVSDDKQKQRPWFLASMIVFWIIDTEMD